MELLANLALGFETALSLQNLAYAFIGCLLGTLIGVLPGLGPLATISMLLPFSYGLDPTTALIMLAGIYYGAAYGGSTTAILLSIPGETSSVVTVLDGHKMAEQGRAGVALSTAAIASFFAGCVGTLLIAAFSTSLVGVAIRFGASEYFALMLLGLIAAISLSAGSILKAIGMVLLGILIGLIGTDVTTGTERFTFGMPELWEGMSFIAIAVGVFAFGEVIASVDTLEGKAAKPHEVSTLWPNREDIRRAAPAVLRGTTVGSLLGILPGAGLSISSFMAYSIERRFSKFRRLIGTGAIEGVAAPEAANNAASQTAFIPTLALGIPGSATMALMLGAMTLHDIQPGPQVMTTNPALFWGLIASMWIGNVMLVVLNLPLVGLWVRLLRVSYVVLFPIILLLSCIGVYGAELAVSDVMFAAAFGVAGFIFRKLDCEPAPLMLGFILGPMMETAFRRGMVLAKGDVFTFFASPITLTLITLCVALVASNVMPHLRKRKTTFIEEA